LVIYFKNFLKIKKENKKERKPKKYKYFKKLKCIFQNIFRVTLNEQSSNNVYYL